MPVSNELKSIATRISESVRRARNRRQRQESETQIDRAATSEARDRQLAKDDRAAASESPAEQGGEG